MRFAAKKLTRFYITIIIGLILVKKTYPDVFLKILILANIKNVLNKPPSKSPFLVKIQGNPSRVFYLNFST